VFSAQRYSCLLDGYLRVSQRCVWHVKWSVIVSNVAVTQSCYLKTVSKETKEAMQKMESALTATNVTPKPSAPTNRTVQ